jgi:hypothetical protein
MNIFHMHVACTLCYFLSLSFFQICWLYILARIAAVVSFVALQITSVYPTLAVSTSSPCQPLYTKYKIQPAHDAFTVAAFLMHGLNCSEQTLMALLLLDLGIFFQDLVVFLGTACFLGFLGMASGVVFSGLGVP